MLAVARMAFELSVPFLFAPMQADPQLAYLYSIGVVQCIASRDSDLAVFTGYILRELDVFADTGVLYAEKSAEVSSCVSTLRVAAAKRRACHRPLRPLLEATA